MESTLKFLEKYELMKSYLYIENQLYDILNLIIFARLKIIHTSTNNPENLVLLKKPKI